MTESKSTATVSKKLLNIDSERLALEQLTVGELRERYAEVWGETTRSRHRTYLIRRIIWRMQSLAYGGLSDRALKRAAELADESYARVTLPKAGTKSGRQRTKTNGHRKVASVSHDRRLPAPGHAISRIYKGRQINVLVKTDGFEYDGHPGQDFRTAPQRQMDRRQTRAGIRR